MDAKAEIVMYDWVDEGFVGANECFKYIIAFSFMFRYLNIVCKSNSAMNINDDI